jgi:hypothetical protein
MAVCSLFIVKMTARKTVFPEKSIKMALVQDLIKRNCILKQKLKT